MDFPDSKALLQPAAGLQFRTVSIKCNPRTNHRSKDSNSWSAPKWLSTCRFPMPFYSLFDIYDKKIVRHEKEVCTCNTISTSKQKQTVHAFLYTLNDKTGQLR